MLEYDVFLSYNHSQKDWARKLASGLEQKYDLRCFFDEWDVRPGDNIRIALRDGILKSRRVALVLSPESTQSGWVELETSMAAMPDPSGQRRRIIPIYRVTCDVPLDLGILSYIDFRGDAVYDARLEDLAREIQGLPPVRRYVTNKQAAEAIESTIKPRQAPGSQIGKVFDLSSKEWQGVALTVNDLVRTDPRCQEIKATLLALRKKLEGIPYCPEEKLEDLKEWKEALNLLTQFVSIEPSSKPAKTLAIFARNQLADIFYKHGMGYFYGRDSSMAIVLFRQAIALNPGHTQTLAQLKDVEIKKLYNR